MKWEALVEFIYDLVAIVDKNLQLLVSPDFSDKARELTAWWWWHANSQQRLMEQTLGLNLFAMQD